MPELVWGHVHAEVSLNRRDNLNGEGLLVLLQTLRGDEQVPVHIGIKPRQDLAPVPAKSPRHFVWNLGNEVLFPGLHLVFWDVEDQTPLRPVGLAEMPPPVEPTEVLWSEGDGELKINSDRHLRLDEIDRARLQARDDLRR